MNNRILSEEYSYNLTNKAATDIEPKNDSQDTEDCVNILLTLKNRSEMAARRPEPLIPLSCDRVFVIDVQGPKKPSAGSDFCESDGSASGLVEERAPAPEVSLEKLLDGSELVLPGDRDLVPDPLYISMAQMKPCRLQEGDRVGSYKGRPVGFIGFCCKHCGGQPGYGKFFPNSVRSLAQTTTSQTIVKHIAAKCGFTPPHVRETVTELQRQLLEKEKANETRPRYGSRKVFFQRIWSRLHDGNLEIPSSSNPSPPETDDGAQNSDDRRRPVEESESGKMEDRAKAPKQPNLKRKSHFGDSQGLKRNRASG